MNLLSRSSTGTVMHMTLSLFPVATINMLYIVLSEYFTGDIIIIMFNSDHNVQGWSNDDKDFVNVTEIILLIQYDSHCFSTTSGESTRIGPLLILPNFISGFTQLVVPFGVSFGTCANTSHSPSSRRCGGLHLSVD